MDTLCGIGLPELIIIALVGFVVIGPQRTRELGLTAGRWLRRAMRSEWYREFNQITGALRDLPNTLVRMAELEDDLRRTQADINRATRTGPGAMPTDNSVPVPTIDPTNDPWGLGVNPIDEDPLADTPPSPDESAPNA